MKCTSNIIATLLLVCWLFPPTIFALTINVSNHSGEPVENTVISAFAQYIDHSSPPITQTIVIDQIDKEFIDHITPIQLGTAIDFPNHDQIRHHVYSFSSAKNFDIPLYKDSPEHLILFDRTGVVSLGCNIHDWMSAYIYVVDTPYFTTTDKNGAASLNLPTGEYEIRYWHPNIDEKNSTTSQQIKLESDSEKSLSIQLDIKQSWSFRRGPLSIKNQGRYR